MNSLTDEERGGNAERKIKVRLTAHALIAVGVENRTGLLSLCEDDGEGDGEAWSDDGSRRCVLLFGFVCHVELSLRSGLPSRIDR